ncbi:unnamed protein product [Amoebophrya sp. A120]|nr:unnamed protein product [Amoebophrya sp. A120]|eukprot:GSA120T00013678001.1
MSTSAVEKEKQPPLSPSRQAAQYLIGKHPVDGDTLAPKENPLPLPTLLMNHYPTPSGVLLTGREKFVHDVQHALYCEECGQVKRNAYQMPSDHFRETIETCLEEAIWKAGALSGKDVNELTQAMVHVLTVAKPNPKLEAAAAKTMRRYQENRVMAFSNVTFSAVTWICNARTAIV